MTSPVIHQPRVARDAARAFVRIVQTPYYEGFADQVLSRLGPDPYLQLQETRDRVRDNLYRTGGDRYVTDVEAGKWRARFEELLRTRPELAGPLIDLTAMVPRF